MSSELEAWTLRDVSTATRYGNGGVEGTSRGSRNAAPPNHPACLSAIARRTQAGVQIPGEDSPHLFLASDFHNLFAGTGGNDQARTCRTVVSTVLHLQRRHDGAIFAIWMKDSEIAHNRFERTQMGKADEFYGIKVRQGKRCRVHHNTIEVNFSMEFPFENDEVIEINEPYSNFNIRNNHIITRTTKTPRTEGLFGFNSKCDFATMTIRDNVIECLGQSRPLLRTDEISGALNENNRLRNVSDTDRYKNEQSNRPAGLEEPLKFECGVYGEFLVDGWDSRTASLLQLRAGRRRRYSRRSKLSRDRHRRRSNRHLSLNNRHLS